MNPKDYQVDLNYIVHTLFDMESASNITPAQSSALRKCSLQLMVAAGTIQALQETLPKVLFDFRNGGDLAAEAYNEVFLNIRAEIQ